MLTAFLALAAFALLLKLISAAGDKVDEGEAIVHTMLTRKLDQAQYRVYRDIILPTADGTTQIDHIVVSRYGIFVIETKNYSGWIFGNEYDPKWTQRIYKKSSKFQNPLRQNYKHVKTVEALAEIDAGSAISIVCFVGACEIKTGLPANVVKGEQIIDYIGTYQSERHTDEELKQIEAKLQAARIQSTRQNRKAHIEHVQRLVANKPDTPECPVCGGRVVERTIKKGERAGERFLGCARYPRCRGVIQIKNNSEHAPEAGTTDRLCGQR